MLASPLEEPPGLTALAWTGYLLAVDSAVFSVRGQSLLRSHPERLAWLAVLSVFLWMPFEWYNLRLAGWYRSGLPLGPVRYLLLGWSFACVWPALFLTADLLLAVIRPRLALGRRPDPGPARNAWPLVGTGAACLVIPVLVPRLDLGEHMLGLAGVGFLLLLDPWNAARGQPALWKDWAEGGRARPVALAASGLLCGLFADGLNWLAGPGWHCIWGLGPPWRAFELPIAAYAVFPFFGAQAFAMHVFAADLLGLPAARVPSSEPLQPPQRPLRDAPGEVRTRG